MLENFMVFLIILFVLFFLIMIVPAVFHAGPLGNYMWEKLPVINTSPRSPVE